MIEYKIDRNCGGQDIYFDGKRVGWLSFGDLREMPWNRRPETLLGKGTQHHDSMEQAKQYVESFYQTTLKAISKGETV